MPSDFVKISLRSAESVVLRSAAISRKAFQNSSSMLTSVTRSPIETECLVNMKPTPISNCIIQIPGVVRRLLHDARHFHQCGHRALPIRPNYIGKSIPTARADRVQVRLGPQPTEAEMRKSPDRVVLYSMVESIKEPERAQ